MFVSDNIGGLVDIVSYYKEHVKTISELDIIVDTDSSKASIQDNLRDQILSKASLEEGMSNV